MAGEPEIFVVGDPRSCLNKVMRRLYDPSVSKIQKKKKQHYHHFVGAASGQKSSNLPTAAELASVTLNQEMNQPKGIERVKWWDFRRTDDDKLVGADKFKETKKPYMHYLMNFALKIGVRTEWVMYVNPGDSPSKYFIPSLDSVINTPDAVDAVIIRGRLIHREEMPLLSGKYWNENDNFESMLKKYGEVRNSDSASQPQSVALTAL
jgi:hypothetical protein